MGDYSRTKNSIKNAFFAVGGKFFNILVQFILRTIFIKNLNVDYLGVSGLFTNILSFLALAELGVGTAITFSLYKPIAENDNEKIIVLMRLFKRAYISIGIAILCIGSAFTPFLNFFYKDLPNVEHINLIYILFVINSGISYFFSYKTTFVIANQKNYIATNNTYLFNFIAAIFQSAALIIYHNYLLYLVIQIIFTFASNVSISIIANRKFPVLLEKSNSKLDEETKHTVITNIRALVYHKLGGIIVFSTDNILLSKMFGVTIVGYYSNYSMIISSIEGIIAQAFSAIAASIGNLGVTASSEHKEEVYKKILFVDFWIYSFCSIAYACLITPFITLWAGRDYLMSTLCCVFIVLNFYIKGLRQTNMTFNSTFGFAPYYKYMPIPECSINILSSIILGYIVGPAGIFIGTTISTVSTCLWIEAKVLFNHGFHKSVREFFRMYFRYFIITAIGFAVTFSACYFVKNESIFGFFIRLIIVLIIPNTINVLFTFKTEEFNYLRTVLKRYLKRGKIV